MRQQKPPDHSLDHVRRAPRKRPQDTPTDTPYKLYDPTMYKPSNAIYVETAKGIEEISTISGPIKSIQKSTLVRYYYPVEAQDLVLRAAAGLQKGVS